jgi:hypothetical protein
MFNVQAMKQYVGDDTVCGFGVDDNWYPDSSMRNGTMSRS